MIPMNASHPIRYTVRAHPAFAPSHIVGAGVRYPVQRAWRIYADGVAIDSLVVEGRSPVPYRTIVDESGRMLTSWHIGLAPGDMARKLTSWRS
jgi:hypothetical protein